MSASESSPLASNLHESIEQLIAETVKRSQTSHEEEKKQLTAALHTALGEIEAGQSALNRAAEALRSALHGADPAPGKTEEQGQVPAGEEASEPAADTVEEVEETPALPAESSASVGPHDLDVIAHNVTIGIASSLQSMLRGLPEVKSAQTREFVNGELRLELAMESSLDMDVVNTWIAGHHGEVATQTDSVLELRFRS